MRHLVVLLLLMLTACGQTASAAINEKSELPTDGQLAERGSGMSGVRIIENRACHHRSNGTLAVHAF